MLVGEAKPGIPALEGASRREAGFLPFIALPFITKKMSVLLPRWPL